MGLYDQIQTQIESRAKDGGISPIDLIDLPPRLRKIMRLMLRNIEMSQHQLREATADLAAGDRLSDSELNEALDSLTRQNWLLKLGQEERVTYKVNLRRKGPSTLASGIWGTLDQRLAAPKSGNDQE